MILVIEKGIIIPNLIKLKEIFILKSIKKLNYYLKGITKEIRLKGKYNFIRYNSHLRSLCVLKRPSKQNGKS